MTIYILTYHTGHFIKLMDDLREAQEEAERILHTNNNKGEIIIYETSTFNIEEKKIVSTVG